MLKGRGRDPRASPAPPPPHLAKLVGRPPAQVPKAPLARPEPDYEVVEFPSDQYVNAKLQPPPPPPARPPTGHPVDAGAPCGLCGGGGARVRCAECGRRALCASCDDMYHRHPKRRDHQRQALSTTQLRDVRPPLPPKAAPPVPPPRRHKVAGDRSSASPRPPAVVDNRRPTFGSVSILPTQHNQSATLPHNNHLAQQLRQPVSHPHAKMSVQHAPPTPSHMGSMPYLGAPHVAPNTPVHATLGHPATAWNRQPRFNMPSNMQMPGESWDQHESVSPQGWGRPLRRGASVLELSGGVPPPCPGCAHCAMPWRYGSCANLDHPWMGWQQTCCPPPHPASHMRPHPHGHMHVSQTPQPYRRADSRAVSRAASRAGSRAASPAMSVRSRTSRRSKLRTPSPPPLPSSDADSESESEDDHRTPMKKSIDKRQEIQRQEYKQDSRQNNNYKQENIRRDSYQQMNKQEERGHREEEEEDLPPGPAPPPPSTTWQCEHCTFVNEPGVRVCAICCKTPTAVPKEVEEINVSVTRMTVQEQPSPPRSVRNEASIYQNGQHFNLNNSRPQKEKASTGCGPSPPREESAPQKPIPRLVTPTREASVPRPVPQETSKVRHDMAVGPSPPRETQSRQSTGTGPSPSRESVSSIRPSPYKETKQTPPEPPKRHSVSVGPSPPREKIIIPSVTLSESTNQKKSAGTSPPRERVLESRSSSSSVRATVSNTGTSPPPQSISTQTYEVPTTYDRAASASRSRSRRRFRDDARRERSHSRHSLSSDTRESERSAHTSGGRWEWREPRDSSPGGEWSENERRRTGGGLTRRASHLDLRRNRPNRRSSFYGSEAPSPEPLSGNRAVSLEALMGAGASREAERGLELARLMSEAERLGFSAAEVHAALAQNPVAPLAWLRERWPSLCAGVRAAATRLAPAAAVTELEARAALARHRGAMWPAVTDCVERHRRQVESVVIGEEGRLRGHVWGSPAGADDDAAPPAHYRRDPRTRAEDSSDEFDMPTSKFQDDDWMYLPLDTVQPEPIPYEIEPPVIIKADPLPVEKMQNQDTENIAQKLKALLIQAGVPTIDEKLLLKGLLASNTKSNDNNENNEQENVRQSIDFDQSENDFINAYNDLTRASPLPSINKAVESSTEKPDNETNNTQVTITNDINDANPEVLNNISLNNLETISNQEQEQQKPNKKLSNTKLLKKNKVQNHNKNENKDRIIPNDRIIDKPVTTKKNAPSNINKNIRKQSSSPEPAQEERSSNLNDIVGDTQRLIQQMKDEIHSDIISLDDRDVSESEMDNSSNESDVSTEHDSSYSESEEDETDDVTSEDKETSSSDEENIQKSENNLKHTINRASSEDNEQFEEAMDHLEEQMEDFKQSNIEILDSIARSLQEEEAGAVQVPVAETKPVAAKRQDFNNNFASVNSFEEIYEELATDSTNETTNHEISVSNAKPENNSKTTNVQKPIIYVKQELNMAEFKAESPVRLIITENPKPVVYNAEIDIIEEVSDINDSSTESITSEENIQDDTIVREIIEEIEDIIVNTLQTNLVIEEPLPPEQNDLSTSTSEESIPSVQESKENNIKFNELNKNPVQTVEVTIVENALAIESTNVEEELPPVELKNEFNTDGMDLPEQQSLNIIEQNIINNMLNEKDEIIKQVDVETIERKVSPEKTTKIDNTNGKNTIKSAIPKLVNKIFSGNKQKEKNAPKIVASKVPVRRGSLKQHPAPNPPKSHFGNTSIRIGHVKQLQTQLFNTKTGKNGTAPTTPPATTVPAEPTLEIKASTSTGSTLNKKKTAPAPPSKDIKQSSPTKEKKKPYFRETCRTEDEWTESDSEDSQVQENNKSSSEPERARSPPPPLTVRRVSGQLIDLAKVRLSEGSPERQARMLLAEGATETWEQAQLAVELVARGAEPPAALLAALECADLTSAIAYLHQECELCASAFPEHEMVSMLRCTHRCCRDCAHHYFTVQITERSIADCVCPYCKEPELESLPEDEWLEYFAHLDILLKTLLEFDVHELFQRKLRDRTLARDPNFRWCVECSSGFFVHPKHKKLRCPECRSVSCASCRKPWSSNHEGLSCEAYAAWLEDNDPERSIAAVNQHLRENGLECPRCHFKYSLSRGGCMHFTCTQCKYEFCSGCGKPFTMGARCGLSEYCGKLGLHAHHPRNCLFYLRDKEPHELQTLLQMNNVTYETNPPEGSSNRCPIQLQRETPTGLVDGVCGSEAPPNYAGLCKAHYTEYLATCARALDPIPIMDVTELVAELRRRALPLPERGPWDTDPIYAGMCAEIVREKIPLE